MLSKILNRSQNSLDKNKINILRLIRTDGIGPKTFFNIINYYGDATKAIENLPDFFKRINKKPQEIAKIEDAEKEISELHKNGADFVCYNEDSYPKLLFQISDPPPVLSYKGRLNLANMNCASIVGARNCSISGKQLTSQLASSLKSSDINVVSGLARGIDTAAHEAALPSTIAVIAGGIDNIYPPENHKLYEKISKDGLIFAELKIGSVPLARHFPQRNRIISGLSLATIIVEAGLNSGSLITAKFALEQNREIFACPGFPLDPRSKGSNKLIKDGANILEGVEDVLEIYKNTPILNDNSKELKQQIPICNLVDEKLINNESRRLLLESLSSMPISIDELSNEIDLPIPIIVTLLLELELSGKIVYHPGNRYSLNYDIS